MNWIQKHQNNKKAENTSINKPDIEFVDLPGGNFHHGQISMVVYLFDNCEKSENRKTTLTVGSFPPNAFGLYDMYGNTWEWCSDWYGEYDLKETSNPKGPETGELKVLRGSGWRSPPIWGGFRWG